MNFVILTDYYHPIVKSGSIIVGDLSSELMRQGNGVIIVTFADDLGGKFQDSIENGIRIIRIRSRYRKSGVVGRLWSELRYSPSIIKVLNSIPDLSFDSIICYSPSIFYGQAIQWLKKISGAKAYLIIRDIFPQWVVDAGIIKKGFLYKFLKTIESNLYDAVDFIGIEASSNLDYFKEYAEETQLEVLDNWSSPVESIDMELGTWILDESRVNIVYGGNMGDAQDLLSLVESMDHSVWDDQATLTLIGEGSQADLLREYIVKNDISGVKVLPPVNRKSYLSLLQRADIGLVSLSRNLASHNYPLKMVGYTQFGIPILASVNEGNEIIELIGDNNAGFASVAGDREAFNQNLKSMVEDKGLRRRQGENALQIFNDRFTVEVAVTKILRRFD